MQTFKKYPSTFLKIEWKCFFQLRYRVFQPATLQEIAKRTLQWFYFLNQSASCDKILQHSFKNPLLSAVDLDSINTRCSGNREPRFLPISFPGLFPHSRRTGNKCSSKSFIFKVVTCLNFRHANASRGEKVLFIWMRIKISCDRWRIAHWRSEKKILRVEDYTLTVLWLRSTRIKSIKYHKTVLRFQVRAGFFTSWGKCFVFCF